MIKEASKIIPKFHLIHNLNSQGHSIKNQCVGTKDLEPCHLGFSLQWVYYYI